MSDKSVAFAMLGLFATMLPALADDGAASLAMGSVTFSKNTQVRMASEDLYISPVQVRVRFEFVNDTDRDVETVVAFPVPDLKMQDLGSPPQNLGATTPDLVNFVGFKVSVNGKPVQFATEQRALLNGADITALLKQSGMPLNVAGDYGWPAREKALRTMSRPRRTRLVQAGAIEDDTGFPNWTMRTRFYWTQRFPAHGITVIEHAYQPVSGNWNSASYFTGQDGAEYCVDAQTRAAIKAIVAQRENDARYVDYILKTARTWNGPIGHFRMTLDKLKPSNALSLCWDGSLKKTGTTTFEFKADNYMPAHDIHMLVAE